MQFDSKILTLLSAIAFAVLSCEAPEIGRTSDQTEMVKTEIIEFMGEKVVIPTNFPKELFNQSQEEFAG